MIAQRIAVATDARLKCLELAILARQAGVVSGELEATADRFFTYCMVSPRKNLEAIKRGNE